MISQDSPNNKFRLILKEKDEIPWGPVYYSAKVENCRIILWFRIFGENFLWSADSKYLFLQEWFTIDRKLAPKTGILAINLVKRRKKLVVKPVKAWAIPKKFDGNNNVLEYEIIKYSRDEKFNPMTYVEKSSVKVNF